ncbi:hypothetical protein AB0O68_34995 [Streptomyces sp. NPDC087512]|uniref:hypothetical protein n=1 Tax=Streptomyces sp. NPDC087512 TaxID=3155059 RepID=UPI003427E1F1
MDATADVVGIAETSAFATPIRGHLDGRPWIDAVVTQPFHDLGLAVLARMLQSAAYIVIA